MSLKSYYSECSCRSPEHTYRYAFDAEEKLVYMEVFLNYYFGFFKRLWEGVKYICGHKSIYGHFDSAILDIDEYIELRDKFDEFIDKVLIEEFNKKEEKKWEN